MKPQVKSALKMSAGILVAILVIAAWVAYFHNDFVLEHTPAFLQSTVKHLGQHIEVPPEPDEEPDPNLNNIPVHVAPIATETLHRYIEGYGMVAPRPPRKDQMSGSANIASPIAGLVAKINCTIGQKVKAGDVLLELDARLAKSAEDQAAAALAQEEAALAALKAMPRPEQVQIAQFAIEKAQAAVDLAQRNYDRQKALAVDQGTPAKNVEQAAADLASAGSDLQTARRQMDLLKASPTAEELKQQAAKVAQSAAALAAARLQTQLGVITAPIDATVVAINTNPGEAVDSAKTLITLIAMDRLMVDVDVPADELPAVPEGLAAVITLNTDPRPDDQKTRIEGTVAFVSPQVESRNGAVMVAIDLPADVGGVTLRPGLTVRVRIVAEEHKNALVVPRDAVVQNENGDSVVSVVTNETAIHRTVKTGLEEGGKIEIITDLKAGDSVVTQGAFGLRALQQTHVKVVE